MQKRPPAWLAPARGSVLAALVTLLTATGHVIGGGTLAGLTPLVVLVPLLATALVALAERCRGLLATLTALGAGQLVLHYLLLVLTAHAHAVSAAFAPAFAGAAMVAAHAAATLATAVVVTCADAAVTALLGALRRVLPRRLRIAPVDVAPRTRAVPDPGVALVASLVALAAHARRGPPLSC